MTYAIDMSGPSSTSGTSRTSELASELRLAVMRLRRRLALEQHPDNELSLGAMAVLALLFRDDTQTVGDLARAERVKPPSMTRTVNCLTEGGYVVRTDHPGDGRQTLISLSDRGRVTLLADRRRRDAWLHHRLVAMSAEDLRTLERALPLLDQLASSD